MSPKRVLSNISSVPLMSESEIQFLSSSISWKFCGNGMEREAGYFGCWIGSESRQDGGRKGEKKRDEGLIIIIPVNLGTLLSN